MLSRVADSLFWMNRYLERAESAARLLDATLMLDLDLTGVVEQAEDAHLRAAMRILHQRLPEGHSGPLSVCRWAGFAPKNSYSVNGYINRARNNARGIRGTINPEVWRAINTLYWQLRETDTLNRAAESPHDFFLAVEQGSHYVQGVCQATLPHDERWHFLELGKYFERIYNTLRVLEITLRYLNDQNKEEQTLQTLQWAALLRSCRAYDAYLHKYMNRVEPRLVVDFLLHDPNFPRSVRFCLEQVQLSLLAIEAASPQVNHDDLDRLLGRLLASFRYSETVEITEELPDRLHAFNDRADEVSSALQHRYAMVA